MGGVCVNSFEISLNKMETTVVTFHVVVISTTVIVKKRTLLLKVRIGPRHQTYGCLDVTFMRSHITDDSYHAGQTISTQINTCSTQSSWMSVVFMKAQRDINGVEKHKRKGGWVVGRKASTNALQ